MFIIQRKHPYNIYIDENPNKLKVYHVYVSMYSGNYAWKMGNWERSGNLSNNPQKSIDQWRERERDCEKEGEERKRDCCENERRKKRIWKE